MRGIGKHDFYAGIINSLGKFLIGCLLFFVLGFLAVMEARVYEIDSLSFVEIVTYIFCGEKPFVVSRNSNEVFQLPIAWFVVQAYIAYVIGSYPLEDLHKYSINLLIRTKSRGKWWFGKVFWAIASNILIYIAGYLGVITSVICVKFYQGVLNASEWKDILRFEIRPELASVYGVDFSVLNRNQVYIMIFIFPIVTSITLSLLQLSISVAFGEVVAYGAILFLCVGGAYYENPMFIAALSMATRTAGHIYAGKYAHLLHICMGIMLASGIVGYGVMKKKDIYGC
ncbi:MAG: hypothetical protein IKK03_05625 [Lachnospiraceae bacterium]|nr:hypothetical protein [Lachnospiraceae bacterium]